MADQRSQDVVHVRGPGRRADAAGAHRSRPIESHRGLSLFLVEKPQADGHGFCSTKPPASTVDQLARRAGWRDGP